jgi:peptidoglycan/LPS O-acetylase OafA/YrhL
LLACVIGTARGRDFFERMPGKPFLVLAILVALDVSLLTTRGATFSKYVVGYTVEPVLVALLIPFVIPGASGRAMGWFLNAAPVNMVGKISYGVYLFHPFILSPVRRVVEHASGQAAVGIAASVLLVLGVALLSFRYFESPVRERLRAT